MFKPMLKFLILGWMLGFSVEQVAMAQFRGFGRDRGGDRGGSDRDREEMRRRWAEMRSRFSGGERDGDRGGSDDWRRRIEEMRSRYSGGDRDRGDDRGRGDSDRSRYDRSRSGDSRSQNGRDSGKPAPYVPTPHTPVAVELPGNYLDGDTDGDGQITLLEWRQWKPQEIAKFLSMDTNEDGFLTAREVIIAENFAEETASAAPTIAYSTSTPPKTTPTTPTPKPSRPDADGNRSAGDSGEKASAAEARYVFTALDKSRDGQLSAEEWSTSRSVREGFQKAGISLKLPTDLNGFIDQYPAQRIVPQLRLPN